MASQTQPDLFAPLSFSNGAPMAQNKNAEGGLRHCAIGGSATGANPAKSLNGAGAPILKRSGANDLQKIEYYRAEIAALTAERIDLMPAVDSFTAAIKHARDRLKASHEAAPLFGDPAAIKHRIALHNEIVAACGKWGKQSNRYKAVTSLIKSLEGAIETIQMKEVKK